MPLTRARARPAPSRSPAPDPSPRPSAVAALKAASPRRVRAASRSRSKRARAPHCSVPPTISSSASTLPSRRAASAGRSWARATPPTLRGNLRCPACCPSVPAPGRRAQRRTNVRRVAHQARHTPPVDKVGSPVCRAMHTRSSVHKRQAFAVSACCASQATFAALSTLAKTMKKLSPCGWTWRPLWLARAARISRWWSASTAE